jgi:hypothetical protein
MADYVIVYFKRGAHLASSPWSGDLDKAKKLARDGLVRRGLRRLNQPPTKDCIDDRLVRDIRTLRADVLRDQRCALEALQADLAVESERCGARPLCIHAATLVALSGVRPRRAFRKSSLGRSSVQGSAYGDLRPSTGYCDERHIWSE